MIVRFWNIGRHPVTDLARLSGVGVIVLAEAGDRQPEIARWAKANGYRVYNGDGSEGASRITFLVARTAKVVRAHTTVAHPKVNVGRWGAGAGVNVGPKVINEIELPGGLVILGTHLIASASRRPPLNREDRKAWRLRRRLYRQHIAELRDRVELLALKGKLVLCVGDFNARPSFSLLAPLRRIMRQWVTEPTHTGRIIDHAWTHDLRVEESMVIPMPGGDHDAVHVYVTSRQLAAHLWSRA